MAYNFPNYYQPMQYPTQMNVGPTQPMQIQNSGFVSVRSEQEARNYPVAYGNSVTFKDETAPYVYTKTMGFSQLDRPVFEKYKLVKEESAETPIKELSGGNPMIDALKDQITEIWAEIDALKGNKRGQKTEVDNDEQYNAGNANVSTV